MDYTRMRTTTSERLAMTPLGTPATVDCHPLVPVPSARGIVSWRSGRLALDLNPEGALSGVDRTNGANDPCTRTVHTRLEMGSLKQMQRPSSWPPPPCPLRHALPSP